MRSTAVAVCVGVAAALVLLLLLLLLRRQVQGPKSGEPQKGAGGEAAEQGAERFAAAASPSYVPSVSDLQVVSAVHAHGDLVTDGALCVGGACYDAAALAQATPPVYHMQVWGANALPAGTTNPATATTYGGETGPAVVTFPFTSTGGKFIGFPTTSTNPVSAPVTGLYAYHVSGVALPTDGDVGLGFIYVIRNEGAPYASLPTLVRDAAAAANILVNSVYAVDGALKSLSGTTFANYGDSVGVYAFCGGSGRAFGHYVCNSASTFSFTLIQAVAS